MMRGIVCYSCQKELSAETGGGKGTIVAYKNKRVHLSPDYTCVDVLLTDGRSQMNFLTPVCRDCARTLPETPSAWPRMKDQVMFENRQAKCNLPMVYLPHYMVGCAGIIDMTADLIAEGVIAGGH